MLKLKSIEKKKLTEENIDKLNNIIDSQYKVIDMNNKLLPKYQGCSESHLATAKTNALNIVSENNNSLLSCYIKKPENISTNSIDPIDFTQLTYKNKLELVAKGAKEKLQALTSHDITSHFLDIKDSPFSDLLTKFYSVKFSLSTQVDKDLASKFVKKCELQRMETFDILSLHPQQIMHVKTNFFHKQLVLLDEVLHLLKVSGINILEKIYHQVSNGLDLNYCIKHFSSLVASIYTELVPILLGFSFFTFLFYNFQQLLPDLSNILFKYLGQLLSFRSIYSQVSLKFTNFQRFVYPKGITFVNPKIKKVDNFGVSLSTWDLKKFSGILGNFLPTFPQFIGTITKALLYSSFTIGGVFVILQQSSIVKFYKYIVTHLSKDWASYFRLFIKIFGDVKAGLKAISDLLLKILGKGFTKKY